MNNTTHNWNDMFKIEREPSASLLHSMALRYRHDFDMDDNNEFLPFIHSEGKQDILDKMKTSYEVAFKSGYLSTDSKYAHVPKKAEENVLIAISALLHEETVEDITTKLKSGNYSGILISAKQIYEEIVSEGFYQYP